MNLNKKVAKNSKDRIPTKRLVQAGAVTLVFSAMVATVAINSNASSDKEFSGTTAGVFNSLYYDDATLQVSGTNVTSVGLDSESAGWILSLMTNAEDFAYVRTTPSDDGEIAGKLRKGDMARVESLTNNGWYQITSGNLTGYIKADVSLTGQSCKDYAQAVGYNGSTGITVAEEEAAIAAFNAAIEEAARQEAAKKAAASASSSVTSTQKSSYSAAADEVTLLAAIVEKEAGGSGYQGMLAVASVVMNRVRSSSYPDTVEGVIGQKGQFTGGISGLSNIISRGPSSAAIRAAEAALAGEDIVDGKVSFRSSSTGYSGTVIGDNVFF
ncbi:MAG: cell wall hydrolase [Lachnospiraceae bacterium]|nr:cell wall hydrolase [Lachnospiraceae bacterium]